MLNAKKAKCDGISLQCHATSTRMHFPLRTSPNAIACDAVIPINLLGNHRCFRFGPRNELTSSHMNCYGIARQEVALMLNKTK